jgi:hypothetical protein
MRCSLALLEGTALSAPSISRIYRMVGTEAGDTIVAWSGRDTVDPRGTGDPVLGGQVKPGNERSRLLRRFR